MTDGAGSPVIPGTEGEIPTLSTAPASEPEKTATPGAEIPLPGGDPAEPKEPRLFTQEEMDSIVGKRLARDRRAWEREQHSRDAQAAEVSPAPVDFISREQFDSDDAFIEAATDRKVAQREAHRQVASIMEAHGEREESARDKYDDYDAVITSPSLAISETMAAVIRASDIGPEVAYHLGHNLDEARRIYKLGPFLQAKEIGKLEAKLTIEPPVKKTSSAPAPLTPIRPNGGSKVPVMDTTDPRSCDTMNTSDWIAAENERVRKRQEAWYH